MVVYSSWGGGCSISDSIMGVRVFSITEGWVGVFYEGVVFYHGGGGVFHSFIYIGTFAHL